MPYNEATEAYNTATNHYENGHYFSSLKSFRKAIALNPYNSDYPFGIALSYYETKKYDSAIKYIGKAIELAPNQPDYHYRAGNIYFHAKRYKEAIENYTIALRFNGADDIVINENTCHYNRGISAYSNEDYPLAIEDLTYVLAIDSLNAQAYHVRGVCHVKLEQMDHACKDLSKADELGWLSSKDLLSKYCE